MFFNQPLLSSLLHLVILALLLAFRVEESSVLAAEGSFLPISMAMTRSSSGLNGSFSNYYGMSIFSPLISVNGISSSALVFKYGPG